MNQTPIKPPFCNTSPLLRYYRFHSRIYDLTRWTYLFGRKEIIQKISEFVSPARILEVGCGTGKNLIALCRIFPGAEIVGLDISAEMLAMARKKLQRIAANPTLLEMAYDKPLKLARPFDLILFSYCLSMINPGWERAIDAAYNDLAVGGVVAVVDFHDSSFSVFKRWMRLKHVRMDGHLLPLLRSVFQPRAVEKYSAYGGLWKYLVFIGERLSKHVQAEKIGARITDKE